MQQQPQTSHYDHQTGLKSNTKIFLLLNVSETRHWPRVTALWQFLPAERNLRKSWYLAGQLRTKWTVEWNLFQLSTLIGSVCRNCQSRPISLNARRAKVATLDTRSILLVGATGTKQNSGNRREDDHFHEFCLKILRRFTCPYKIIKVVGSVFSSAGSYRWDGV